MGEELGCSDHAFHSPRIRTSSGARPWARTAPWDDRRVVIARYRLPEMAAVFSDEARLGRWLEIELLATEAWAALGVVPAADAAACRAGRPTVDEDFVAACDERERSPTTTSPPSSTWCRAPSPQRRADAPAAAKWIHYGLTSSDVVDTAWCWMLRDAADLLLDGLRRVRGHAQGGGAATTATPR